nr:SpoIIE family protein phosphatase [Spirochaetota bacterium]
KELEIRGMMLGVVDELDFGSLDIGLEVGDSLVLLTDGITEAQNPSGEFYEPFFYQRIKGLSSEKPEVIVDESFLGLYGFTKKEDFNDDVTMICIKRNG